MNKIAIARETIRITKEKQYTVGEQTVFLPEQNYAQTLVYTPETGAALPSAMRNDAPMCTFSVTTEDSFEAARQFVNPLVMNFANAHSPGGGFLLGAQAQEEALCRCSTLYASLTSEEAKEMYHFNNTHLSPVESDYILLSPVVCVFRDVRCELLKTPFSAAVITLPAPNRRGAAIFASNETINQTILRRIRIMLRIAAANGYRNLVLGAWGCGEFGNKPEQVAATFRQVLIDEQYGTAFDEVRFAIYGRPDGRNYLAFQKIFDTKA